VTVTTLQEAFLPFGDIADVSLPKNENPNSTEPHRGFAYVEFEDAEDAKEAIDNMDQAELFGRVIKVSAAKAPKSAGVQLGGKTAVWEQVGYFCPSSVSSRCLWDARMMLTLMAGS
jgi:RNA recognition motif-containing protein